MIATIIDGKELAGKILLSVKTEISKRGLKPRLDIVKFSGSEATEIYVRNKVKRAEDVGIKSKVHNLSNETSQEEIGELIDKLNKDKDVTGFFIQTPVPSHVDLFRLTSLINPGKDVDCMSYVNLGRLWQGQESAFVPATALAVLKAIKSISSDIGGKHAVVVGRSAIIGKPLAALLLNNNCTVTICHSKTKDLDEITKTADILIAATGKENLITSKHVKKEAIVIDCGSPKQEVCFAEVKEIASFITPVPGGIGPLTIACLLRNLTLTTRTPI